MVSLVSVNPLPDGTVALFIMTDHGPITLHLSPEQAHEIDQASLAAEHWKKEGACSQTKMGHLLALTIQALDTR